MLFWNAGLVRAFKLRKNQPDDVAFVGQAARRSCHRGQRRSEASLCHGNLEWRHDVLPAGGGAFRSDRGDRPISGTMAIDKANPTRPVPVIHFHGLADTIVPFAGIPNSSTRRYITYKSVDDTMKIWTQIDGCTGEPKVEKIPDTAHDGTTVTKTVWGGGKNGAEVILYAIDGGGHTWPGRQPGGEIPRQIDDEYQRQRSDLGFFQAPSDAVSSVGQAFQPDGSSAAPSVNAVW